MYLKCFSVFEEYRSVTNVNNKIIGFFIETEVNNSLHKEIFRLNDKVSNKYWQSIANKLDMLEILLSRDVTFEMHDLYKDSQLDLPIYQNDKGQFIRNPTKDELDMYKEKNSDILTSFLYEPLKSEIDAERE